MIDLGAVLIGAVPAVVGIGVAAREWWQARRRVREYKALAVEARYAVEQLVAAEEGEPDRLRTVDEPALPLVPAKLVSACAAGDCVLFMGTGISAAAGQPTWSEALLAVLRICERTRTETDWQPLVKEVKDREFDLVADLLESRLGSESMQQLLRQVALGEEPGRPPPPDAKQPELPYPALRDIGFAGVLSSLWDDVAVRWFTRRKPPPEWVDPDTTEDFGAVLRNTRPFVVPAYGSLPAGRLLLTADSFEDHLADNEPYARFLGSLFASRTVLFLGASVAGIEDFLRSSGLRAEAPEKARENADGAKDSESARHYALVPRSAEATLYRERLRSRFNVQLLLYDETSGHPEVTQFTEQLEAEVAGRRKKIKQVGRATAEPLRRVELRNIGPFDEVDIEFDDQWTILVGDNGSGKSTILRAIALVLCGDDDRALASGRRLLKDGAGAGSVRVTVGDTVLETRLTRDKNRVRVMPRQISPAQTGEWLVLGFPPIRGISTGRGTGRREGARGRTIDDVLPLVTGGVDARFDDVSQWVLNQYHLAGGTGLMQSADAPPVVKRLFSVMNRLSPGETYGLKGVNDDLEVLVGTADWTVPVSVLSQGMSSILSWTGTLIMRLNDLGPLAREGHQAIVMVDEIDAHLHPAWQRKIVKAVDDEFGSTIQVIATTHAPLVVGSVPHGRIWRLTGERGTPAEEVHVPDGARADQILTGPVFDTDSRNVATEEALETYGRLAIADEALSPADRRRLDEAARKLRIRLPSDAEREAVRKARELIEQAAADKLAEIPPEERREVIAELRLKLQEGITGSERPQ